MRCGSGALVESTRERVTEKGAGTDVFVRGRRVIVTMPRDTPRDVVADLSAVVVRYAKLEIKIVDDHSHYMTELYQHVSRDPQATVVAARDGAHHFVHAEDPNACATSSSRCYAWAPCRAPCARSAGSRSISFFAIRYASPGQRAET